jgi:hypothetical protein
MVTGVEVFACNDNFHLVHPLLLTKYDIYYY